MTRIVEGERYSKQLALLSCPQPALRSMSKSFAGRTARARGVVGYHARLAPNVDLREGSGSIPDVSIFSNLALAHPHYSTLGFIKKSDSKSPGASLSQSLLNLEALLHFSSQWAIMIENLTDLPGTFNLHHDLRTRGPHGKRQDFALDVPAFYWGAWSQKFSRMTKVTRKRASTRCFNVASACGLPRQVEETCAVPHKALHPRVGCQWQ